MRRQEEKLQLNLQSWIDDLFWRALEWVLANAASWVVDTTKAGVVHNALSHLVGAKSKGEFVCGAVRGFGSNLLLEKRAELAKQIYSWGNETPAEHRRPLDGKYEQLRDWVTPQPPHLTPHLPSTGTTPPPACTCSTRSTTRRRSGMTS